MNEEIAKAICAEINKALKAFEVAVYGIHEQWHNDADRD